MPNLYGGVLGGGALSLDDLPAGEQKFLSSGVFTVPYGVEWVQVLLVGGGGGGRFFQVDSNGGAGGGGGYVVLRTVRVREGESITVVIGSGGTGSYNFTGQGGSSSISGPALIGISSVISRGGWCPGRGKSPYSGGDGGSGGAGSPKQTITRGGTNGADGPPDATSATISGGVGQGTSTFGYGSGGDSNVAAPPAQAANTGRGGNGYWYYSSPSETPNYTYVQNGSSGIVIFRWGNNFFV